MGYADPRHKGLQQFQEVKAKGKEKAILRKEILENNPRLADKPKQLEAIVEGALRAQEARTVVVANRGKGKHRRK